MQMDREKYMKIALELAREAAEAGEVPVGCVIVDSGGRVIGTGRNRCQEFPSATRHAEIEAIENAARSLGDWRLTDCAMFVTLEPCPMCAGAIINSRLGTLVYGAKEPRTGSCGSVVNLFMENYGFSPKIYGGALERECAGLLADFFANRR